MKDLIYCYLTEHDWNKKQMITAVKVNEIEMHLCSWFRMFINDDVVVRQYQIAINRVSMSFVVNSSTEQVLHLHHYHLFLRKAKNVCHERIQLGLKQMCMCGIHNQKTIYCASLRSVFSTHWKYFSADSEGRL